MLIYPAIDLSTSSRIQEELKRMISVSQYHIVVEILYRHKTLPRFDLTQAASAKRVDVPPRRSTILYIHPPLPFDTMLLTFNEHQ